METVKSNITNEEVAQNLHLSHSMISRLRSGGRNPSFETMIAVERKLGWMMESQVRARAAGRWEIGFEEALVERFDKS